MGSEKKKPAQKFLRGWGTVALFLGLVFFSSCQPPRPVSGPEGSAGPEGVKPAAVKAPSPLIKVTVSGKQDRDDPGIIHVSVIPFLDPQVISQYGQEKLILEVDLPRGLQAESQMRKRTFVSQAHKVQLDTDIRVINVGDMKIKGRAVIMTRQGEELSYGEGELLVKSKEGGIVEFEMLSQAPTTTPKEIQVTNPQVGTETTSPEPTPPAEETSPPTPPPP